MLPIDKIVKPWCIQIEPTCGCNRRCVFCGCGNEKYYPKGKYLYMTMATAEKIAPSAQEWIGKKRVRLEIALSGEPTLNPNIKKIIALFRCSLPRAELLMYTNCSTLHYRDADRMQQSIQEYLDAGINLLILDTYAPERTAIRHSFNQIKKAFDWSEFIKGNKVTPWLNYGAKIKKILIMEDLARIVKGGVDSVRRPDFINHAGSVDYARAAAAGIIMPTVDAPLAKMCTLPFHYMPVFHDGSVGLCCQDFAKTIKFGNINDDSLENIWHSKRWLAVRSLLRRHCREFLPCSLCSYFGGARPGIDTYDAYPTLSLAALKRKAGF